MALYGTDYLAEVLPTVNGGKPKVSLMQPHEGFPYLWVRWGGVKKSKAIPLISTMSIHALSEETGESAVIASLNETCKLFLKEQGLAEE